MAQRVITGLLLAAIIGLGGAYALGAFESEPKFSAEGFVEAANREGADIALGAPLEAVGQPHEIVAVELEGGKEGHAGDEHAHSVGSLVVTGDAEAAIAEFERCETALSLVCYRAANAVLRVESQDPAQLLRLEAAIRALGSD